MQDRNKYGKSRRDYLKKLGTAAGGISLIQPVSAKQPNDRKFLAALKQRKKHNWDLETWFEQLEKRNIEFGTRQEKRQVKIKTADEKKVKMMNFQHKLFRGLNQQTLL